MSCRDCVFRGTFQDMGASCDVCGLQTDLLDAVRACENSAGCRHRFTKEEAKRIVIERAGGIPIIAREKGDPWREIDPHPAEALSEALQRMADSAKEAANSLIKALNRKGKK